MQHNQSPSKQVTKGYGHRNRQRPFDVHVADQRQSWIQNDHKWERHVTASSDNQHCERHHGFPVQEGNEYHNLRPRDIIELILCINLKMVALPYFRFLHPHMAFLKAPPILILNLRQAQRGRIQNISASVSEENLWWLLCHPHSPFLFNTLENPCCFKFINLSSYRCQHFEAVKCSSSCCSAKISSSPPEGWLPSSSPRTDFWVDADTQSDLAAVPWELNILFQLSMCVLLGNNKVLLYLHVARNKIKIKKVDGFTFSTEASNLMQQLQYCLFKRKTDT